ncbi:MAG: hypothetical protein JO268_05590, partial [Pseudonocardiales bacterium]|nr:hypothetical protein [Pseudonocardiales bacterium]
TVLAQRIRECRLTLEEFCEQLEVFARENNEVGTVSIRHVQRIAAGQFASDRLRPATARLLERYFESPIEELLVSPGTKMSDPAGVLDPDGRERLSRAASSARPCRADDAAIEALAAVLVGIRHLEDETSAAAVFPSVQQQQNLADQLAAGVRAQGRPTALGLSSEIHQYLGWLSIPLGRWDDADRYLDRAAVLAVEADDPLRLSTALSFQAYARLRRGDLRKADSLSEVAQRDTRVHIGLRTYITYQRAEVLARDNDRASAVHLLTEADRMGAAGRGADAGERDVRSADR